MENHLQLGKAIVIEGSMAGLMIARVMADVNHNKMITENLFPGFEEELAALGSPSSLNKTVHIVNETNPFPST
ncbi:hypothetical protein [Cohnella sp. REN36]|uniref:hypothetical protein n=1 Tax=Cohnella sp. REN36 TaxID=2887347 RepID=UPI001D142B14|nr:hypothetical protein [Cohnella sp. REN36]MCC3373682.1 hypothetical protein [Cohnella sp. REN36]